MKSFLRDLLRLLTRGTRVYRFTQAMVLLNEKTRSMKERCNDINMSKEDHDKFMADGARLLRHHKRLVKVGNQWGLC